MTVSTPPSAAIFDMDGVLVNSNPFHIQKWIAFLKERRVAFDPEAVPRQILGMHNDDAFRTYFGATLTPDEMRQLGHELEAQFRRAFRPHAQPMPGLVVLLDELADAGIPMAVASSAIRENVEFVVDVLNIRRYFRVLVSGDEVTAHKPAPDIYQLAARELGAKTSECVAFEDSPPGIAAAKNAGMKCIAIASTFPLAELETRSRADLALPGFEGLTLTALRKLFSTAASEGDGRRFPSPAGGK